MSVDPSRQNAPQPQRGRIFDGLSAQLLALIVMFVMLAELLIYSPSIALFRRDWLQQRIVAAHLAAQSLEATPDHMISEALKNDLLALAGARAIVLARPGDVRRVLSDDMPQHADVTVDLRERGPFDFVIQAYATLLSDGSRILRVIGASSRPDEAVIEVVLDEAPLREEMVEYSWGVLGVSLAISFLTAALIYLVLQWLIVHPLRRIGANLNAFRDAPEDPANVIALSARSDEIGAVQQGLAEMEEVVRASLRQRARLAALGEAVAKINHDLRGVLATAQLLSDRLAGSSDPAVRKLAPTLIAAIDRAVTMCSQSLDFARDDLPPPKRARFALAELLDETGRVVSLVTGDRARWRHDAPAGLELLADRDQLFRAVVNLGSNAVEAGAREVWIAIRTGAEMGADSVVMDVADDGPGLAPRAREKLFMPFTGSARPGGTGLGLAIARDIARAHGGDLSLVASDASGAVFRFALRNAVLPDGRAAEKRASQ